MRRKWIKLTLALGTLLVLSACILLPDFVGQKRAGKYDPAGVASQPRAAAHLPVAEVQTEPHTCGLHAMRSLYAAYGLEPSGYRLRFRLGTDQPATRADKSSAGTLHPDLYRVLAQDGFAAQPIDLAADDVAKQLTEHLDERQLALAVIYRGTYHWVLLGGASAEGRLAVVDSLREGVTEPSVEDFLGEALSVTLVRPAPGQAPPSAAEAHAQGLTEMGKLFQRK